MKLKKGIFKGGGITLFTLFLCVITSTSVLAWSATCYFVHTAPFIASVTGGQEDAEVTVPSGTDRELWSEGSYLTWTSSSIANMQSEFNNGNATACVFHVQQKNTSNGSFNNDYSFNWSATNLPGAQRDLKNNNLELRYYITQPGQMSSTSSYYCQGNWLDNVWPSHSYTGSDAQIIYSTYLVDSYSWPWANPRYRDDNAKLCYYSWAVSGTNTGNYYGSC